MSAGLPESPPAVARYPAELEADVVLADGGTVHLRPIRPDDAALLRSLHARLSPETVYFRFFGPRPRLTDREVAALVNVDYADRLALVAVLVGELVGVARYDRSREPYDSEAEVAFVVRDDHQRRGLGTILLEHLAAAAARHGVERFVADTLPANEKMLGVFASVGFEQTTAIEDGIARVQLVLASTAHYVARVDERDRQAAARSIARLLRPRSVAVIGAGRRAGGIGHEVLRNLLGRPGDPATPGFTGTVYAINRAAAHVAGVPAYPSVLEVPEPVDLAVVAVPAAEVTQVVAECGARGVAGVIVLSAGFAESGPGGALAERELVRLAHARGMRVVGPNCLGVINTDPGVSLNATFVAGTPPRGRVAFSSQSGGLAAAVLAEVAERRLGLSSFFSLGNKADVSGNDLLRYWAQDPATDVILLHLESFGNPRTFSRVARQVSRTMPIVAVKAGRSAAGRRSAGPALATTVPDNAFDALFRQTGVIRVDTLPELFDVASVLATAPLPSGNRVAVLGNARAPAVLAADACEAYGLEVPELPDTTQRALAARLAPLADATNPVDLTPSATAAHYRGALEVLLEEESVDAVLVICTPPLTTEVDAVTDEVVAAAASRRKTVVASLTGATRTLARLQDQARPVPWFRYPEIAARALAHVAGYAGWRSRPLGSLPALSRVDEPRARRLVHRLLRSEPGSGPFDLDATGATDLLDCFGIALEAPAPGVARAAGGAPELVVSVVHDPYFGPLVALARTGPVADLLGDRAYAVIPLTDLDATELVRRLPSSPLLMGEVPALARSASVDTDALAELLLRVSRLGDAIPELTSLRLEPVIASAERTIVLGALASLAAPGTAPSPLVLRRLR